MGNNNYFPGQLLKFESSSETDPILNNLKNLYIDEISLIKNTNLKIKEQTGFILKPLNKISRNKLLTRSENKKEKIKKEKIEKNSNNEDITDFIPINYEIIPEKIMNFMFDQGQIGICYIVAGVNSFCEIPSILDQLFIDKDYSPDKKQYKFNVFVNSIQRIISLNDKFLYEKVKFKGKTKLKYVGCQTFKYELFLKYIVKLFAELNSLNKDYLFNSDECQYSIKKLKDIEGGFASEIYGCILGTSSIFIECKSDNKEEYMNIIEKYINIPGNILATSAHGKNKITNEFGGHQYSIKNMIEYSGNGEKKKFITLYNPWGVGNAEFEFFDFNKIKEETKNFEYISKYNEEYSNTGLIKIPLNLFCNWFTNLEICCPKYGYHYKVFNNNLERNKTHRYCFFNNKKQYVEIELFLDKLENIRYLDKQENAEIILEKIDNKDLEIKFNLIDSSNQRKLLFLVRNNAYIYKLLDEGDYLISIIPIYESANSCDYNLRIGGENEYLENISSDKFINLSNHYKYNFNEKIININVNLIKSQYILLEKTYYDLKIYKIAKEIYKAFYNPYENDIEIKEENGLKNIISTITDAYNNNLYIIKKFYENNESIINFLFKTVKDKLSKDDYNLIMQDELEILKLIGDLKELSKNVKVILHTSNDTTKEISLFDLKNIILGNEMEKQKFYSEIKGYIITEYGIENVNPYQKFQNTIYYKKYLDKMPAILKKDENLIKHINFYINKEKGINSSIDKKYCDILFIVDATGSMEAYILAAIANCKNIIERINSLYEQEKEFKYGGIFYRDPIDSPSDEHYFFNMSSDKNEFIRSIQNVKAVGGGDESEDWNGAYEIALNKINWTSPNSNKVIIHIADSGAHGLEFNNGDLHYEEGPKFIKTIKKVAEKGFKIIAFSIGQAPLNSFNRFKEIYMANNGYAFVIFDDLLKIEKFNDFTEQAVKFIIDNS